MSVKELSKEQLNELKCSYYCERNKSVSYGELANIDNLVTDNEVFNYYNGTDFVNDDFFCTCGIGE